MISHYFKVGMGILAAVVILVIVYYRLEEMPFSEKNSYQLHVVFDNIQGLSAGNDVWLSGVKVGSVESIALREDGRASLTLRIYKDNKILRNSSFSVSTGFLQDKNLSIEKPEKVKKPYKYYEPGEIIEDTQSPATIPDLVNEAQRALAQINDILYEVKDVIVDEQLKRNIFQTIENIEMATREAYGFAQMLKDTGVANRENIEATIENIRILTESLSKTMKNVDLLISNANDIVGDENTKTEIKEIVTILKTSMENIEKTTEAIKNLATDDEVQEDLRQTIKSTRATMDKADKAVGSFTRMIESINDTEFRPDFEFRYNAREDLYHADMNVRIFPPNSEVFYLFGYDDLGENQNTNLQFGIKGEKQDHWYRFGIKNGKLGFGFELKKEQFLYYGSLADPNDLRLSLRVGHKINKNLYMTAGWESVFKEDGLSLGFLHY